MCQSKCLPVKGKRFVMVLTETQLWWRNHPIPSIEIVDIYKCLRVWIQVDGQVQIPKEQWEQICSQISLEIFKN